MSAWFLQTVQSLCKAEFPGHHHETRQARCGAVTASGGRRAILTHINLARSFRGGERQCELLIRGIARTKISQLLVCRADAPLCLRLGDVDDLRIRPIRHLFTALLALRGSDLIHVHEGRSLHLAALFHLLTGTPYLTTRRVIAWPDNRPWVHLAYRNAERIIAISDAVSQAMRAFDSSLDVRVIHSALSGLVKHDDVVRQLRHQWGNRTVIGNIAALDRFKGQSLLIDVARKVENSHPQLLFVLVGSGEDESMFRRQAHGLSNVIFTGFVSNVGDYLGAFDIFALPSDYEGLGSILLDAMSFGLPLIATRVGGIPELVRDGENGLLFEVQNATELAEAVIRLSGDRSLCARMGEAGRAMARGFTAQTMVRQYLEAYTDLGMPVSGQESEK